MNIATSPGLDTATNKMHIIISVLIELSGNNDLFSISIRKAIKDNVPTVVILNTIKDAAKDNYLAVIKLLGFNLTNKILAV